MFTLYEDPDTASLVVRVVMHELGLPFETVRADGASGVRDTERYRAMQPLGLVPVLETPDGPMFETAAILLWLADRHGGLAPDTGSPERAAFLKWFFFVSTNLHPTLLQLYYPHRPAGEGCAAQVLEAARARMGQFLTLLDGMIATESPGWLSEDQPSILGHYLGLLLRWLQGKDAGQPTHFPLTDYPALRRVLAAHQTRPAALTAATEDGLSGPLYTVVGP